MSNGLPEANQRILQTPHGSALGASYRWKGGQYCAIHTSRGVVGCGIYDIDCADEFGMAFALDKCTSENPLREPEDLYEATIVRVSEPARALNITEGMTGMEALARMLAD